MELIKKFLESFSILKKMNMEVIYQYGKEELRIIKKTDLLQKSYYIIRLYIMILLIILYLLFGFILFINYEIPILSFVFIFPGYLYFFWWIDRFCVYQYCEEILFIGTEMKIKYKLKNKVLFTEKISVYDVEEIFLCVPKKKYFDMINNTFPSVLHKGLVENRPLKIRGKGKVISWGYGISESRLKEVELKIKEERKKYLVNQNQKKDWFCLEKKNFEKDGEKENY